MPNDEELVEIKHSQNTVSIQILWIFLFFIFLTNIFLNIDFILNILPLGIVQLGLLTYFVYKKRFIFQLHYMVIAFLFFFWLATIFYQPSIINYLYIFFLLSISTLFEDKKLILITGFFSSVSTVYLFYTFQDEIFYSLPNTHIIYLLILLLFLTIFFLSNNHLSNYWKRNLLTKQKALQESEQRYRTLIEQSPDPIIVHKDFKIVYSNKAGLQKIGYTDKSELIGQSIFTFLHKDTHHFVKRRIRSLLRTNKPLDFTEATFLTKNGGIMYGEMSTAVITFNNETAFQVIIRDITDRKDMEQELISSKEQVQNILESISDAFFALNEKWEFTYVNSEAEKFLFKKKKYLIGASFKEIFPKLLPSEIFEKMKISFENKIPNEFEVYHSTLSTWYNIRIYPSKDGVSVYLADITERKQAEVRLTELNKKLKDLSNKDSLTGISNRRHFEEQLMKEWKSATRKFQSLSILMIDIDHFKEYNDYYGHQAGDDCLRIVAKTINKIIKRPKDIFARYGGEEFIIALPETDKNGALHIASIIRESIIDLQIANPLASTSDFLSVSIGLSSKTPTIHDKYEDLIKEADKALYLSKKEGRNKIYIAKD